MKIFRKRYRRGEKIYFIRAENYHGELQFSFHRGRVKQMSTGGHLIELQRGVPYKYGCDCFAQRDLAALQNKKGKDFLIKKLNGMISAEIGKLNKQIHNLQNQRK